MHFVFFPGDRGEWPALRVTQHFPPIVLEEIDTLGDIAVGLGPALADLKNKQRVKLIAPLAHGLCRGEKQLGSFARRYARPDNKCALRCGYRIACLRNCGGLHSTNDLRRMRGINRGELLVGAHAFAADDQLVILDVAAHAGDRRFHTRTLLRGLKT